MTWLRLSDDFADRPEILAVGAPAAWLHTTALLYCARHLTDGHLTQAVARRLAVDVGDPDQLARALIQAGLWQRTPTGYYLPEYLAHNPSRADVEALRTRKAAQMAQSRGRRRPTPPPTTAPPPPDTPAPVTGNMPATPPPRCQPVTAPRTRPVPVPVSVPLPLPPVGLSSSTRVHPDLAGLDVLLLTQLLTVWESTGEREPPRHLANRQGLDRGDPTVRAADLIAELRAIGVEPAVAQRLVLTYPRAAADWLDHPERWEFARNRAGLLVRRISEAGRRAALDIARQEARHVDR